MMRRYQSWILGGKSPRTVPERNMKPVNVSGGEVSAAMVRAQDAVRRALDRQTVVDQVSQALAELRLRPVMVNHAPARDIEQRRSNHDGKSR